MHLIKPPVRRLREMLCFSSGKNAAKFPYEKVNPDDVVAGFIFLTLRVHPGVTMPGPVVPIIFFYTLIHYEMLKTVLARWN